MDEDNSKYAVKLFKSDGSTCILFFDWAGVEWFCNCFQDAELIYYESIDHTVWAIDLAKVDYFNYKQVKANIWVCKNRE
ncbi:hypothetical protein [Herbiconiux daphne]|uniref:Uncharacterized protein n=1 Tax=Herbiconiux daphne TaxID=2970914 RepID=A0ABT2HAW3_9MICO|nr:hypothetical protein [Herbiconiux daphne]MCS5737089.1 hypothetical protein [Herbiconiux daphne]